MKFNMFYVFNIKCVNRKQAHYNFTIFVNIENIIISTFIFVIKRLNHDFFLDRLFQRIIYINVINMNNDSLKIILYSLNNKK